MGNYYKCLTYFTEEGVYQGPEILTNSLKLPLDTTEAATVATVASLGCLRKILEENIAGVHHHKGDLDLAYQKTLMDLGGLEYVAGTVVLIGCTNISSLGKLQYIGGDFFAPHTLTSLGGLEKIGGSLYLGQTGIKDLGNLREVGGQLQIMGGVRLPPDLVINFSRELIVNDSTGGGACISMEQYKTTIAEIDNCPLTRVAALFRLPAYYQPFISERLRRG